MNNRVNKITKQRFFQKLQCRDNEDVALISTIDKYFVELRGWTIRRLQSGEKVILTLSGGLDSVVAWGVLMEKYGCEVYPLHVATKNKPEETASVKFFSEYYRLKFPALFHEPKVVHSSFLQSEFRGALKVANMHPESVLSMIADRKYTDSESNFFWGTNTSSIDQSLTYLEYLKVTENIEVRSIVCGVTAEDGVSVRRQTLTYLRTQMLQGVVGWGIDNLQVFSLYFEPEIGVWMEKSDIISVGASMDLPLWKTYSCYLGKKYHCGKCMACESRRAEFNKAMVSDRTKYIDMNKSGVLDLLVRLKIYLKNAREKVRQTIGC